MVGNTHIEALREAAQKAIDTISKQHGHHPICCGCPVPGHPGDGYLQPPDPPMCCQQFEQDVNMLLGDVQAALSSLPATCEQQPAERQGVASEGWDRWRYSYQTIFDAIAAATRMEAGGIGVSVHAFHEAMLAASQQPPAQESAEPVGYLSEHNLPETSPYRWQFSKTNEGVYRDNALWVKPVYFAPQATVAAVQPPAQESATLMGFTFVNDPSVQEGEIRAVDADGKVLGKIVGLSPAQESAEPVAWQVRVDGGSWGPPITKKKVADELAARNGFEVRGLCPAPQAPVAAVPAVVELSDAQIDALMPASTTVDEGPHCSTWEAWDRLDVRAAVRAALATKGQS